MKKIWMVNAALAVLALALATAPGCGPERPTKKDFVDFEVIAVNGGWLVRQFRVGMVFIPDPNHATPPYPVEVDQ